jgi:putative hydrolase of the HAD superfamily
MRPGVRKATKGVFFDLYGTLLILGNMQQAWSDWMDVLYATLCPRGSSPSKAAFENCCHQFFGKEQPAPANDGLTIFERRIHRLASSLDLGVAVRDLQDAAAAATDAWQAYVRTDPAALEVLSALRQSKTLALISNFDHPPHVHRVIRETGLDVYFQTIVVSGDVGIKKPDPGIFLIALEATGLTAEEVVYVGDTQEDVEGATAAGIRPILIVRPEDPSEHRLLDYTRRAEAERTPAAGVPSAMTVSSLREVVALVTTV